MNERERAEWLARAIDDLIQGNASPERPAIDDEELSALLRVARARLEAGSLVAREGAGYEGAVWERVVSRLEASPPPDPGPAASQSLDVDALRNVISARRRLSREVAELAEEHRDEVWQRIQERIDAAQAPWLGERVLDFVKRHWRVESRAEGAPPATRTRLIPTAESDIDSLLKMAVARPSSLRVMTDRDPEGVQERLWKRMDGDLGRQQSVPVEVPEARQPDRRPALAFAVGVALLIGALALLPFTGLADHPAVEAAGYLTGHLGVTETESAPPPPGDGTRIEPEEIGATEAGARLGVLVAAPPDLLGMTLDSTQFYAAGLSGDSNGVFVAIYESAGGGAALAVYQEAAGEGSFSVPVGAAERASVGGVPATYFEGNWTSEGGELIWSPSGTQTVVFEDSGVRTVMQYAGRAVGEAELLLAAGVVADAR